MEKEEMIKTKRYWGYLIILFLNILFPLLVFIIISPINIQDADILFILNILITTILFIIYIIFSMKKNDLINYDIELIKVFFKNKFKEKKIKSIQLNLDLFIISTSLVIPNLSYLGYLFVNGVFLYSISLIPFLILLAIASVQLIKKGKKAIIIKKQLLNILINELENDLNNSSLIKIYLYIKDYNIIIYPKISIFFIIIGIISQLFSLNIAILTP